MIDRDQLREALGAWFADEEWFPREAGAVLAEAARLVVEGREVWICNAHKSEGPHEHSKCWYAVAKMNSRAVDNPGPCRMVRMILIDGGEA